jgi:hypothetical protein
LEPLLGVMAGLVRAKKVSLHKEKTEVEGVAETEWHEFSFDDKRVHAAVC